MAWPKTAAEKLRLNRAIEAAYAAHPSRPVSNDEVAHHLLMRGVISAGDLARRDAVGASGEWHNLTRRAIRWHQQTMRASGLIESTGRRSEWQLTREGREMLTRPTGSAACSACPQTSAWPCGAPRSTPSRIGTNPSRCA